MKIIQGSETVRRGPWIPWILKRFFKDLENPWISEYGPKLLESPWKSEAWSKKTYGTIKLLPSVRKILARSPQNLRTDSHCFAVVCYSTRRVASLDASWHLRMRDLQFSGNLFADNTDGNLFADNTESTTIYEFTLQSFWAINHAGWLWEMQLLWWMAHGQSFPGLDRAGPEKLSP